MSESRAITKKMNSTVFNKTTRTSIRKIDLTKLDASEESLSSYAYPKEFLKLDLDKIRDFIEILEEHYQNMVEQQNVSEAKAVKQRLILLRNLEKEKMKKEAKIIYSNQRELVEDKMKEEIDNYVETATKEFEPLLQSFEKNEVELLNAQKQELEEFKKNFDYIYESHRPKPTSKMLNWIKKRDFAVKQNQFYKAEEANFEINELQKKVDEKFENDKEKVYKEELAKLLKSHQDEKNSLLKRKNNLINVFNKTKNKNVNQIRKKYETKLKELKNYQSFELASFDKITKGITKPSYRIQNIVNSTAKLEEGEKDNENIAEEEQEQEQKNVIEKNEEEEKEKDDNEEEENNVNKDGEIKENNNENNEVESQPKEEEKNEINNENNNGEEMNAPNENNNVNEDNNVNNNIENNIHQ